MDALKQKFKIGECRPHLQQSLFSQRKDSKTMDDEGNYKIYRYYRENNYSTHCYIFFKKS